MHNVEYKVYLLEDMMELGFPAPEGAPDYDWAMQHDPYGNHLIETINGNYSKYIGSDGQEPEDNTLTRDYRWVADALNQAYREGYDSGYDDGY